MIVIKCVILVTVMMFHLRFEGMSSLGSEDEGAGGREGEGERET